MEEMLEELLKYLYLYRCTAEAMKVYLMPIEEHEILSGLVLKLFQHAASFSVLAQGTRIERPPLQVYFWDLSSSYVLVRAAVEAFAVFHYIFVSPQNHDELTFRMCIHRIRGLKGRAKMPTTNLQHLAKIASYAGEIENLKKTLIGTQAFKNLPETKKQKAALRGVDILDKTAMIKAALWNLGPGYAEAFYAFMSDYAHSGYISMFQNLDADTADKQKKHLEACIVFFEAVLLGMITALITRYPAIEQVDSTIGNQVRALNISLNKTPVSPKPTQ